MIRFLEKHFRGVLTAALAVKIALAWWVPFTGDEAYFYLWGRNPAYGYYDHPPMAGWWMTGLLAVGRHPAWLRVPAIIVSFMPAVGVYLYFRKQDESQARRVALLALGLPLFFINVLIATDTPLVFFGLLSIGFCQWGINTNRRSAFLLCGLSLGLAFLSKYFAVLIGASLLVYFAVFARKRIADLLCIGIGFLPAAVLNGIWNWNHSWQNLLFNTAHRRGEGGFQWGFFPLFLFTVAYAVTPWILWHLWRYRKEVKAGLQKHNLDVWITTSLVPLLFFLLLSPFAKIGLHWLAVFVPGLFALCFFLPPNVVRRSVRYTTLWAIFHVLIIALALALPLDLAKEHRLYNRAVLYLRPGDVAALFSGYPESTPVFTGSYSRSALLSYYSGRHVGVIGTGSHYGREDDRWTDFSTLDGTDMVILLRDTPKDPWVWAPYFEDMKLHTRHVRGAAFTLAEGSGFRYSAYREDILNPIRDRFYQTPEWLPQGPCPFRRRYFTVTTQVPARGGRAPEGIGPSNPNG